MSLKAGARLKSSVCDTEVIVVRAPDVEVDLRCGGQPMVAIDADAPAGVAIAEAHRQGTLLGKRYAGEDSGIELLCTKPGEGSLSLGEVALPVKEAKPLPASD